MLPTFKVSKDNFLAWLNKYGLPIGIYDFNGNLSFDGSDGLKISDRGLKSANNLIPYDNPEDIDEYIKEACIDSFGAPLKFPKVSFSEYLKTI